MVQTSGASQHTAAAIRATSGRVGEMERGNWDQHIITRPCMHCTRCDTSGSLGENWTSSPVAICLQHHGDGNERPKLVDAVRNGKSSVMQQ